MSRVLSNISIYDYSIQALNSNEVLSLSSFRGKKMLLVNVASHCGYTPQYKALQELWETYKDQLVIIGFPCNQFLFQESAEESKIAAFCQANYGVDFPMTMKIKVKGKNQHPIYHWLTSEQLNGVGDFKVSWNFNKFLIDEEGKLLEYFSSKVKPLDQSMLSYFAK